MDNETQPTAIAAELSMLRGELIVLRMALVAVIDAAPDKTAIAFRLGLMWADLQTSFRTPAPDETREAATRRTQTWNGANSAWNVLQTELARPF